jgi:hypothetical protein
MMVNSKKGQAQAHLIEDLIRILDYLKQKRKLKTT